MTYSYLFEIKSIQSYLFRSGKLKDVIATSERLDNLIDSSDQCVLFQVLQSAGIKSDLLDANLQHAPDLVRFLRCKGGAFYACCQQKEPLTELRSLWTLTVQQLFPSMTFVDALVEADSLAEAVRKGHEELAADRNAPVVKFPVATAIAARYVRTGAVSVPISKLAQAASMSNELYDNFFDVDTELNRQAYQSLNMRNSAALHDRFTPTELQGVAYPIDLEEDFQYSATKESESGNEAIKDIALIHLDGNGLGILLLGLKSVLQNKTDDEYRQSFRKFSDSLSKATEQAAKSATHWLYRVSAYQHKAKGDKDKRTYLPMRPLVLGGDDLTLLCRADLAMEYSKRFCQEFKKTSQKELQWLYESQLKGTAIKSYLTASGGILYHKAGHPFSQSHHLVEDLCQVAKKLTKSVIQSTQEVGPAALAFYRLSNAASESFDTIKQQAQQFLVQDRNSSFVLCLGQNAYFVDEKKSANSDLNTLQELVKLCQPVTAPVSIAKWRQMATHLSLGDKIEADRIYQRSIDRCRDKKNVEKFLALFKELSGQSESVSGWYWCNKDSDEYQTIISDMLIVDHFWPVVEQAECAEQEKTKARKVNR